MEKYLKLKLKSDEIELRKVLERKSSNRIRLAALIEKEKHYELTSGNLLRAAREVRKIDTGLSGYNLVEKNQWASKAINLKQYSELRLRGIRFELAAVEKESIEIKIDEGIISKKIETINQKLESRGRLKGTLSELAEADEQDELRFIRGM